MKDLKKIQEFFSKSLNEDYQLDITDFQKVVQAVKSTGHPATVMLVPKWNEIEIITGMNAPDDMIYDISKATSPLGYNSRELSMSGNSSSLGRGEYSEIERVNGGHMDYRFEESLNEMEFGDPVDAVFRKYAGKTIEMDFEDMESDWANLLNDLEEYFPGDKLSDFMDSGEADLYLDDYNITLMEPIMDKEVDLDVLKRAKAKMDIDKMRYDAGMPPMDSIASLNENNLVMDDTITPDMWDREKIKVGIESKKINDPFWFTKPHTIIDFNSRMNMISFDHPAKPKRGLKWVNSFLKDNHKVDMSAEPEGYLSTKYAKSPSAKLKMNEDEDMKKSFTDYSNNELATYCKNNPTDRKAAKELHKRSQALKNLSRTDIEETDINDPVMMKMRAAKDKLAKMRAANAGDDGNDHIFRDAKLRALKAKRAEIMRDIEQEAEPEGGPIANRYGDMLNAVDAEIAKEKAMFGLEESINEGTIGDIQSQLDDLGVEYKMSLNPFKVIYKPVNKDDRWYKDFDDIIFRYNLGSVVKTTMDEAKSLIKVGDIVQKSYASTDEDYIKEFEVISIDKKGKATLKDTKTGKLTGMHIGDLHKTSMNEATKDEETEFHKKLDKLVHDTFGKRKGELEEVNLKQSKLSSSEYQKAKKLKDFKASDWKWNADKDLYTKVNEGELTEAYVPSNIKDFAKRRGVSRLVNTVAGWAEKVGARITGGTAIGYNYNTLILDMGYQTGDIRINVEDETIELYDEPIYSFADFKRVFMDEVTRNQIEHDEEQLRRERGLEEIKQRVFNKLKK